MAVETKRTALVDLSLDLLQKLIAHQHLAGPVYAISHKREPTAPRTARKVLMSSVSLPGALPLLYMGSVKTGVGTCPSILQPD